MANAFLGLVLMTAKILSFEDILQEIEKAANKCRTTNFTDKNDVKNLGMWCALMMYKTGKDGDSLESVLEDIKKAEQVSRVTEHLNSEKH